MKRQSVINRKTSETDISIELTIESGGVSEISSGVPFLDHMLNSLARHGGLSIKLRCAGDTEVDDHHSVEDVAIVLGQAIKEALADKAGIIRFGDAIIPMDDALAMCAIDLSGRPYYNYLGPDIDGYIGAYSCELTTEFFRTLSVSGGINLHLQVLSGTNRHHIHEAMFKAFARALREAVKIDPEAGGAVPSTKGVLA